jgi:hypothetical protein
LFLAELLLFEFTCKQRFKDRKQSVGLRRF